MPVLHHMHLVHVHWDFVPHTCTCIAAKVAYRSSVELELLRCSSD